MIFQNRTKAGYKLAKKLKTRHFLENMTVVGIACGGMAVAAAIAKELALPLNFVVTKKIGSPDNLDLALGAVDHQGVKVFNDHLISMLGISKEYLAKEELKQREIAHQKVNTYLNFYSEPIGKEVILVDDGIATGASMKVAIDSLKAQGVNRIILAIPVAASKALEEVSEKVDEVICLSSPSHFPAVSAFYQNFEPVTDEEITEFLRGCMRIAFTAKS